MIDKFTSERVSPYDLSAVRRTAKTVVPKAPSPARQPYALSSSQRLTKSTVVLRAKRFS
jgi:hypothetical protein